MAVFTLPSLGSDMEAGTLVEWLIHPGDNVRRGDVVAVIETQKGAIEIECFEEGKVASLLAQTGEKLPVGAPLARILKHGETPAEDSSESTPVLEQRASATSLPTHTTSLSSPVQAISTGAVVVPASPAARHKARELGIDLKQVEGSFPGGRIVLSDVVSAASVQAATEPEKGLSPAESMRRAIGAAMTQSKRTIPHIYLSQQVDVQPAMEWLARHNEDVPPAERILMGALFVRATVRAAKKVNVLNGHCTNGDFVPADTVNPGVAVALRGGGLVAPALISADEMSLQEIMTGMRDLVTRARAGRLRNTEMTAGTITVSSLGETGAEEMAGVIFPPQVALMCLGAPQVRPWVVSDEVVPRHIVNMTLSADHRVCDGREAARFITEFSSAISDPETL